MGIATEDTTTIKGGQGWHSKNAKGGHQMCHSKGASMGVWARQCDGKRMKRSSEGMGQRTASDGRSKGGLVCVEALAVQV